MKWKLIFGVALSVLTAVSARIIIVPYEEEKCVAIERTPPSSGNIGYEFVDLARRKVWATLDWDAKSFKSFEPPWHKPYYIKNSPRILMADKGEIIRSPACEGDGEFNTLKAFGREFRQVVRLVSFERIGTGDAQLTLTRLEKYHSLEYRAGRKVNVLTAPDGAQYIEVARSADRPDHSPALPDRWQITSHVLDQDFNQRLMGVITNIRTAEEDSYQGPLPKSERFVSLW